MDPVQKIKTSLVQLVTKALEEAKRQELLSFSTVPDFVIEVPREKGHGDFACNAAMLLARQARMAPRQIAEILVGIIKAARPAGVEKVEAAGAGFINFYLSNDWLFEVPALVVKLGEDYGRNESKNQRVQVEFVSANPTGNLHMGNARGGALGDTLANILDRAGYSVEREFYINDAGNQVEVFAESLEARYLQLKGFDVKFPEDGYAGQDVIETVRNIISTYEDSLLDMESTARRQIMLDFALTEKIDYIKNTLKNFGIEYDVWFSERSLHETGQVDLVIDQLKEKGFVYEKEGALWFKSSEFGDEKDEVLKRANGIPNYFAADIAYHLDKFKRGFDWVINIWGADHHGHVARMKGAMQALGYDPAALEILLMQLVRLYRGGTLVRMSKRTGTTISLDELIEEVGRDAARFTFVMRSPDSHLDFDLELAKQKSLENPVYYVQYAHARICSVFRQAAAYNAALPSIDEVDALLLNEEDELALLRKIAEFPEEIAIAARTVAPHRMARYVMDLAGLFHSYYNHHRVLNEDPELQKARLLLLMVTRITIQNGRGILGVAAPEQM
ncbi:MAG: arginine--tRNA ligase [Syntrophomonas sp.]